MRTKYCINCRKKAITATGHVNLTINNETIIVTAGWCSDECITKKISTANPIVKKYLLGYLGEWEPWMGLSEFSKNNKLYKKLIKLAEPKIKHKLINL